MREFSSLLALGTHRDLTKPSATRLRRTATESVNPASVAGSEVVTLRGIEKFIRCELPAVKNIVSTPPPLHRCAILLHARRSGVPSVRLVVCRFASASVSRAFILTSASS